MLPRESYRHLIELLEEPATAKLIYHLDSLQAKYLDLLHSILAPLRRMSEDRGVNDLGSDRSIP
jgi:hypothetical protein